MSIFHLCMTYIAYLNLRQINTFQLSQIIGILPSPLVMKQLHLDKEPGQEKLNLSQKKKKVAYQVSQYLNGGEKKGTPPLST